MKLNQDDWYKSVLIQLRNETNNKELKENDNYLFATLATTYTAN